MNTKTATAFERALLTASSEMFADIPEREEDIVAGFSEDFLRRNEALLRETESKHRRYVGKVWKRAVLIAVIVALLTMTAMAVPAVREGIVKLFMHDRGAYFQFTVDPTQAATAPKRVETAYAPTHMPAGFRVQDEIYSISCISFIWVDADEEPIYYCQAPLPKPEDVGGISADNVRTSTLILGDYEVIRVDGEECITYVWTAHEYLFTLLCTKKIPESEMQQVFDSIRLVPDAVIR